MAKDIVNTIKSPRCKYFQPFVPNTKYVNKHMLQSRTLELIIIKQILV